MTESMRSLGQRWFEQVWNQGRREAIAEMMSPQIVLHDGESTTTGPQAFYEFFDRMGATFSEMQMQVEDTLEEGDKVCIRWSCSARHTGGGLGVEPTGRQVHTTGISILRGSESGSGSGSASGSGSQVVEAWQNWDMLGLLEQIQGRGRAATYIAEAAPVEVA